MARRKLSSLAEMPILEFVKSQLSSGANEKDVKTPDRDTDIGDIWKGSTIGAFASEFNASESVTNTPISILPSSSNGKQRTTFYSQFATESSFQWNDEKDSFTTRLNLSRMTTERDAVSISNISSGMTTQLGLSEETSSRLNSTDRALFQTFSNVTVIDHLEFTTGVYVTSVTDDWVTGNDSGSAIDDVLFPSSVAVTFFTCVVLGLIILITIVGNVLVIAAIVLERNLQNVANYLIASLAVADLMVAVLVMPLAAVNEISARWFLGPEVCDMWISFDVLCCTSSILHLVAISVDRYWAVTRVDYIHNRPAKRIFLMIALSWGISTVISIPPLFGWKTPGSNPDLTGECIISQDWGYTVYSTVGAFYIPLTFMIIIYLNVYRAARHRIRKKHFRRGDDMSRCESTSLTSGPERSSKPASCSTPTLESPMTITPSVSLLGPVSAGTNGSSKLFRLNVSVTSDGTGSDRLSPPSCENNGIGIWPDPFTTPVTEDPEPIIIVSSFRTTERKAREKREQTRERKAARTLGIITGSFVGCWLPFFILALVRPFCGVSCNLPVVLVSVIGWLGYFNSLLNPVIYTIFSPDFRSAFRKILFGKYRSRRSQRNGLHASRC